MVETNDAAKKAVSSYRFKTKPYAHQKTALELSLFKKNFAYFMEMGCVDGDVEFLTNRGWWKFKDFDLSKWAGPLLIAQCIPDQKTNHWSVQYTEPISYIQKPATEWVHFRSRINPRTEKSKIDLWVTEDHNMPMAIRVENKRSKASDSTAELLEYKYDDYTALDLYKFMTEQPSYKKAHNRIFDVFYDMLPPDTTQENLVDEEINSLTEWELRFTVAAIADGTFPNKGDNKCDFYFMKERKVDRMRDLCAKAGIPCTFRKVQGLYKTYYEMHTIAPMKTKKFDERWYTLPIEKLCIIADEVFYWDGWHGNKGSSFSTSVGDSADFIHWALIAAGTMPIYSYSGARQEYKIEIRHCATVRKSMIPYDNCYVGDRNPRHVIAAGSCNGFSSAERVSEERMSYCWRVPSGYFLARSGGRQFIIGNSGKTKVMLDNIGILHKENKITGAVIIAPKGVYRNWSDKEIPTHLGMTTDSKNLIVWDASASDGAKRKMQKKILDWDNESLQILVFNVESLISKQGRDLINDFIDMHDGRVMALVDESTCIKNHKAKRTTAAINIGKRCLARRIATGSPVTNSPFDLYSQCAFLDPKLLGFGSFYAFKNTFANIEKMQTRQGQHYEKVVSYKNLDKLSELVKPFSYRITKKECLDLPEKIYVTRDVELTPEQRKVYNEMAKYQLALLQNRGGFKEMSVQIILTKLLRLHQVVCGTFVSDDGEKVDLPSNRPEALKEILDETTGKVIIWATYIDDINRIAEMLGELYGEDSYVLYYGDITADARVDAIGMFQDEKSPVRFFVGNVQTAGRGITLTAANTVIYYSNNFSLESRQQSEDRAHRIGQKNPVTYIDLVCRHTIDEKIIKALISKQNIADLVLKDGPKAWITLEQA